MEEKEITPTEAQVRINKVTQMHGQIKGEILSVLDEIKEREEIINKKLEKLDELEQEYVRLMEKLI